MRSRYLGPLVALGLVEDRGGGVYALVGDFRERQEEVAEIVYGTVQQRLSRTYDPRTKRTTTSVRESGSVGSGTEHRRLRRRRHERQREAFRRRLEDQQRQKVHDEREIVALLNEWDDERSAASSLPEGADGWIEDLERVEEDHPPGCECLPCFYESLTLAEGVA